MAPIATTISARTAPATLRQRRACPAIPWPVRKPTSPQRAAPTRARHTGSRDPTRPWCAPSSSQTPSPHTRPGQHATLASSSAGTHSSPTGRHSAQRAVASSQPMTATSSREVHTGDDVSAGPQRRLGEGLVSSRHATTSTSTSTVSAPTPWFSSSGARCVRAREGGRMLEYEDAC